MKKKKIGRRRDRYAGFQNLLMGLLVFVLVAGCAHEASLPVSAGIGPDPVLPQPPNNLIPTVNIAPAQGWMNGKMPTAAEGTSVSLFAEGLDHPRWLYVLPNGDVLVAETNSPPDSGPPGIKGWLMKKMKKKAGAGGNSADRISLLRDTDGDGYAETRHTFLENLYSPFGMELIGNDFYVANTDSVMRFPYREGDTRIAAPGEKVMDLPAGPINYHWTKNIIADEDGSTLYVTVGSNSNNAEYGIEKEEGRAAIWKLDLETEEARIIAEGLRNPVGMAWEPKTGVLWTAVNERDMLGSDLVPDFMTSVREGGFYGWPYSYFGRHVDERMEPQRPDLVSRAIVPDYALGSHTASLGLASSVGTSLPERFANGMFVGQHGSWNREPHSGYKVIFIPFRDGKPCGQAQDVLTGFLSDDGKALGRPVGVALDKQGALLVADDVGNVIWRVTTKTTL